MRDEQLLEAIERYLAGDMDADERRAFEQLRTENAEVDQRVLEHQQFVGLLKQYGERVELENRLNAIHDEIDVHAIEEQVAIRPSFIVYLWRHHHSKISVAASIAIFAILAILFVTGKMDNKSTYQELSSQVRNQNSAINRLNSKLEALKNGNRVLPQDKTRGTGFAITSNGLIATAFHVVDRADSVFVQNSAGRVFKTKVLYTDPKNDVAILKINDTTFGGLGAIPYTFKKVESDLAENVYTLGYPQDSPVYNAGWVTSLNGFNSDTVDYQVSMPVNPGTSGAPLLDSKGSVIGIVKAKETHMEGVHFALKSNYLLAAIDSLSADSLAQPVLNTKNTLAGLSRQQQVKKLQKYVFIVKVY
ncbi:MAG TPA: trypsin-like peptidase domain-containing protein [Mucilaginibacter sp.]|nr:trypsin-like peptidase domain-containing protein [Mucilaginibacter sp.]